MALIDALWIGRGAAFFPFLNCPELVELRQVSKESYIICKKAAKFVRFYGLNLPLHCDIFYDLFHGNYKSLQVRLDATEDYTIKSVYRSVLTPDEVPQKLTRGCIQYNKQWNGLVLMEIAYMLNDTYAIALLELNKRSTCHMIRMYSSTYNSVSISLTQIYSQDMIKKRLVDLRPPYIK